MTQPKLNTSLYSIVSGVQVWEQGFLPLGLSVPSLSPEIFCPLTFSLDSWPSSLAALKIICVPCGKEQAAWVRACIFLMVPSS